MNNQILASGIERLLRERQWIDEGSDGPFRRFRPHESEGLPTDYQLVLPRDPDASGAHELMLRSVTLLAEMYGLDAEDLALALADDATVFATRVMDDLAHEGRLPLDRFESMIDRQRKVCLAAASAAVTDDPLDEEDKPDALEFVSRCSFLQTRRGSFETRIALPNTYTFGVTLEQQEGVLGGVAVDKIHGALSLICNEVMGRRDDIYRRDFIESYGDVLYIPLIRNIGLMLKEAEFKGYQFRFVSTNAERKVEPPPVTKEDVAHVTDYVAFIREALSTDISVDVIGTVTELRSKDIKSSNNHVRVRGYNQEDRREMDLALSLGRASYLEAWRAHGEGRTVNVVGRARRLKSYYKVDDVWSFRVISG